MSIKNDMNVISIGDQQPVEEEEFQNLASNDGSKLKYFSNEDCQALVGIPQEKEAEEEEEKEVEELTVPHANGSGNGNGTVVTFSEPSAVFSQLGGVHSVQIHQHIHQHRGGTTTTNYGTVYQGEQSGSASKSSAITKEDILEIEKGISEVKEKQEEFGENQQKNHQQLMKKWTQYSY